MCCTFSKGESITLKGHMGAVRSVDFSKDSRHLLTGSDDKTAKVSLLNYMYRKLLFLGNSYRTRIII